MMPRFPFWIIALLTLFLFAVQATATYWHLYFYIWWLDIPVHILGGLVVALFFLTTYYASFRVTRTEKEHSGAFAVVFAVAFVVIVGLFWEVYEFGVDRAIGDSGLDLLDTLKDLADDIVGALLAALIFIHFGYNEKQ